MKEIKDKNILCNIPDSSLHTPQRTTYPTKNKTVAISGDIHRLAQVYSCKAGKKLVEITNSALLFYMEQFPINDFVMPSVINRAQETPVVKKKKQLWKMSLFEAKVIGIPENDDHFLEKPARNISIEAHLERLHYYPDNNDTILLIQLAGEEQAMPAGRMQELAYLNGLPAVLEVTGDYQPINETAIKVMELMPGRESFSKNLLHVINESFDFSIVIR